MRMTLDAATAAGRAHAQKQQAMAGPAAVAANVSRRYAHEEELKKQAVKDERNNQIERATAVRLAQLKAALEAASLPSVEQLIKDYGA